MKSEEIAAKAARYNRVERETDTWGRIIGVRRLKPAEEYRVKGMTADLTGSTNETDKESGNVIAVPDRFSLQASAMVCEIDGVPVTFSKTREELDSVLNRLDQEGMAAVIKCLARFAADNKNIDDETKDVRDEAKNSGGIPPSDGPAA